MKAKYIYNNIDLDFIFHAKVSKRMWQVTVFMAIMIRMFIGKLHICVTEETVN